MEIEEEIFYNVLGEEISRSKLVQEMIDFYQLKKEVGETKITDFNEGSEIRNLLESFAVDLYALMEDQNELSKIMFIQTAEGEWLDKHGENPFVNLPRETGTEASGFVIFSIPEISSEEIIIPEDTIIVSEETGLEYATNNEGVIAVGDLETEVMATCLSTGYDGNCNINSINLIDDDFTDIPELSVTNREAFTGGADYEEDDEYRERLLNYVRRDDFGSYGYYVDLAQSISGVHDVTLIDKKGYTKSVIVNGNVKPVPNDVLVDVLKMFTLTENIVLGHVFFVEPPAYQEVSLDINVVTSVEIDLDKVRGVVNDVFNGGSSLVGAESDGLFIGESLSRDKIASTLLIIDEILDMSIKLTGEVEELVEIVCQGNKVLQLINLNVTQTVSE